MSSMLEQLWPVLVAEVGEKLDALEAMVAASSPESLDVDALFREFHSLKSSFSMVDFQRPMELAHACEDVLHGVRHEKQAYNDVIRQCLIEAVDWLKQQMNAALPGQYPAQANEDLLVRLAPFRPSDDDDAQAATPTAATIQEPAAEDKLAEEREALAVDTLRISSTSLDNLVTNVSQLALREGALSNTIHNDSLTVALVEAKQVLQQAQSGTRLPTATLDALLQLFSHYRHQLLQTDASMQGAIASIQQDVLDLRVIPLSTIFNRLPRIVRKQAGLANKQVQLLLDGGDVLIDKGMIELIAEPLIHLLHNAILHGIESPEERRRAGKTEGGTIHVTASEQGSLLCIDVSDDGCGLDYRAVRDKAIRLGFARASDHADDDATAWLAYLFVQGFSNGNAHRTTGLDVVKSRLAAIGGSIDMTSTPAEGTQFRMRMPVTVAIQSVILIKAADQTFAIPTRHVVEIVELPRNTLQAVNNQAAILLRDNMLPVYGLDKLLQLGQARQNRDVMMLLILQQDEQCIALTIDDMIGRQELFLREIHQDLRNIPGVGGVSLLGDGQVVIILDCDKLFRLAQSKPQRLEEC